MSVQFNKFEEQVFFNTVLIENIDDKEFGTGFLITKDIGNNRIKQLLFSNKHVFFGKKDKNLEGIKKKILITVHKAEKDGTFKLGETHKFQIEIERDGKLYFDHPDKEVDVGCLDISAAYNFPEIPLNMRSLKLDEFSDYKNEDLYCGQNIVFVGYPTGFYDRKNFLPIFRNGNISSIPDINFNGKRQLLIDAQVFPGSSGSPVFVSHNGKYKLLGIIAESTFSYLDFTEVETVAEEKEKQKIPIKWIGLGILFKLDTIKEVFNLVPIN
ncbi:MAG: serine protease [Burkholderiales bacterium]|nr:serine protease [Burkholderiales bacterium]